MICYVDMEHELAMQDGADRAAHEAHCLDVGQRLEQASGDVCVVRHYTGVTQAWVSSSGTRSLIIGGNVTDWVEYDEADLRRLYEIIRSAEVPILGICGGCQLIALALCAALGPMRRLEEGERDLNAQHAPGYRKEWGFLPVHVIEPDPLFEGLGEHPVFLEAHYWEVKVVPNGFKLLASSAACRVQAMRRVDRPVYAIQFHPEAYTGAGTRSHSWLVDLVYPEGYEGEEHPEGRSLLVNFFKLAGTI
jgi:GMP synthase-like glutamine amidotransferase